MREDYQEDKAEHLFHLC